jgi:pilus assembly protein Flp/PilA
VTTLFQSLYTLTYIAADKVADRVQSVRENEKGASAVEYALLVGAIALAVVVAVGAFKTKLSTLFSGINLSPTAP